MSQYDTRLTTGLQGLDRMLKGVLPGDNIVWQIDRDEDYGRFARPFQAGADREGQKLTYFRFNQHQPALVDPGAGVETITLEPRAGFEAFVERIHAAIDRNGHGGYYLLDCLSGLSEAWYSDQMLSNFFMLTCPYFFDMEAVAYFGLRRNEHSFEATNAILSTAQVLLDVYHHQDRVYVYPYKVQARYSPTMHMLHLLDERENLVPVSDSATIAQVRAGLSWSRQERGTQQPGLWSQAFDEAVDLEARGSTHPDDQDRARRCRERLLRMTVSRDDRVLALGRRYLTMADLVAVERRMIGTGLIGGKSVGMLLARAIVRRELPALAETLEPHDSFFIGSDVFYTFLVRNGLWWLREPEHNTECFLRRAGRGRHRILMGEFPATIRREFEDMLDYFGQSPIIVRSSSLLEDNFGNAFVGKYESIFCANQGPRHRRIDDFLSAVRTIYASSLSEKALLYRAERGLLECDEQMGLLVQRVSGRMHGPLFFPCVAGVGFSFNPYVWSETIDPEAGMVRLVCGMGTRAVERHDDDYTRVVALNAPNRRPESTSAELRRYSQHRADVLDLAANQLVSVPMHEAFEHGQDLQRDLFFSSTPDAERPAADVLTFDGLVNGTPFIGEIKQILRVLQDAYECPVDIEFTANFPGDHDGHLINLLQCRPLHVAPGAALDAPPDIPQERIVLRARGPVTGVSRAEQVDHLVYVDPDEYARLHQRDRYQIARLVGRVCQRLSESADGNTILLIGPGRWGTSTPSLGVPVRFAEIGKVRMICELISPNEGPVPDISLGTHFFSDLVERDIMYFALVLGRSGEFNRSLVTAAPNRLVDLLPDEQKWSRVLHVVRGQAISGYRLHMHGDSVHQSVLCYIA